MEVTSDNFEEVLPQVLEDINSCTFASIDLEFTGLWCRGEPGPLDPQDQYYEKFLISASNFICVQYGISLFEMDCNSKRYKCKTYNFFVFPHQSNKNSPYSFSCQASCMDFLASCNFDFNKAFKKGIPYLNLEKEANLSELLEERRYFKEKNASKEQEKIPIPVEHKELVGETCERLGSVLTEGAEDEISVPGLNGYIRRLIYQEMKERYPNGEVLVDTRDGVMYGRKGSVGGHMPKSQLEIDKGTIEKAVGFSKIIKALSKSGKLIVGHNMFLDICHTVNQFLCYAPGTYKEFKGLMKGVFPKVIDTKFFSSCMHDFISNTTLNRLYSRMKEAPFSFPDIDNIEGYSYSESSEAYHEAGFDSYVTGISFISMFNFIAGSKDVSGNVDFKEKFSKLNKFMNKIYMNNSPDNHMNLGGDEPVPERSNYFLVNFPKNWVAYDIVNLFSAYGRININWINDTSAWVNLHNQSQAHTARANLCYKNSNCPSGVSVQPYSPSAYNSILLSKKRAVENMPVSSPRQKRHRSSQENSALNKTNIEVIPEEQEDEEEEKEDDSCDKDENPLRKQFNLKRKSNHGKETESSEESQSWEIQTSRRKRRKLSGDSKNKEKNWKISKTKKKRQGSPSLSSDKNNAIADLEKDLDCDPRNNPFAGTNNWEVI